MIKYSNQFGGVEVVESHGKSFFMNCGDDYSPGMENFVFNDHFSRVKRDQRFC